MIGIVTRDSRASVVGEFFELFKTPWEFCRPGVFYDVVICSGAHPPDNPASLVMAYGASRESLSVSDKEIEPDKCHRGAMISYKDDRIPIYGECQTFVSRKTPVAVNENGEAVAVEAISGGGNLLRIGFDLFAEVEELLRRGQPSRHAQRPTLDLHIAFLRDLIVARSIPLSEIPPTPVGYKFIVCLTHDVDHCGIRNHRFNHSIAGFIYRASLGSVFNLCTGRKTVRQLLKNWQAVVSLPLVYLGWAKDFWKTFDLYRKIEHGLPSTFFVIPKKDDPGQVGVDSAPSRRATSYQAAEIDDDLRKLVSAGCEIGLHGIDAWRDAITGSVEREVIRRITGDSKIGVRMHWLYFNEATPVLLEEAGFSYDSTVGYNDTVGYRAGTTQVFRPLDANQLLELPMHVMDTALFYPAHMNLTPRPAKAILDRMIANVVRLGGALTINWHDRSVAPDRLWDQFYIELLEDLKSRGAWFATAAQAVAWFDKRRSTAFEQSDEGPGAVAGTESDEELPGVGMRRYNATATSSELAPGNISGEPISEVTSGDAEEPNIGLASSKWVASVPSPSLLR